jgi:hypothetical protein
MPILIVMTRSRYKRIAEGEGQKKGVLARLGFGRTSKSGTEAAADEAPAVGPSAGSAGQGEPEAAQVAQAASAQEGDAPTKTSGGSRSHGGYAVERLASMRSGVFQAGTAQRGVRHSGAVVTTTRSCTQACALVVCDSFGGRVVDLASLQPPCSCCRRRALCEAVAWAPLWTLVAVPLLYGVLRLTVGMQQPETALAACGGVGGGVLLGQVVLVLRQTRRHPTLTISADSVAPRRVSLRWPNLLARAALLAECVQHNALALAVATQWAVLPSLDRLLLWPARSAGAVAASLGAAGCLVLWLLCFQAILGRLPLHRPWAEALGCVVLPCLLTEVGLLPLLLCWLSVMPCAGAGCVDRATGAVVSLGGGTSSRSGLGGLTRLECEAMGHSWSYGRMLWEPSVECWGGWHSALSLLSLVWSLAWVCSASLVPLQLYHVRSELQIRQQHWWRLVFVLLKCTLVAIPAGLMSQPDSATPPVWQPAFAGAPSICGGIGTSNATLDAPSCELAGGAWSPALPTRGARCVASADGGGRDGLVLVLPQLSRSREDCLAEPPAGAWLPAAALACAAHLLLCGMCLPGAGVGPRRSGSLVAPPRYNWLRAYGFATAAWSSVCVGVGGHGGGRSLVVGGGGGTTPLGDTLGLALVGWVALAGGFTLAACMQWRRRSSTVVPADASKHYVVAADEPKKEGDSGAQAE